MAEKSFLQSLKDTIRRNEDRPKTKNAADWFRRKVSALKGELRGKFSKNDTANEFYQKSKKSRIKNIEPGVMAAYFYDPKYKMQLPYYDRFPMILCIKMYHNGFLGINFHYLSPLLRAKLMDAIEQKNSINWNALVNIKEIKPTIKRYLWKHITSKIVIIDDSEKNIALFLPLERFKKQDKLTVWSDSKGMIR